ncbi:MAG: response regulator, partial [Polyangia bacterium]
MGKRILVADDSLTIQRAVAMVMDGFGYSLSFARSVDEAMMVAKRDGRPDLVLADVALGSGSGYDLCAELKANADWRDVPVFMLASTQSPYDESRGRQAGADGHMAKPFESQALLDAVASALADPGRTGVMPELVDREENTTRMSARPGEANDDDSYGEISIERGPARAPAVVPWGDGKPEGAASTAPPPAVGPVPPAARPSPRPSLIPGAHSPSSLPSAGEDKGQPVSSPASSPPAATVR